MIVNNYGPDKSIGSIHIEVNDSITAKEIQLLEREIQTEVYSNFSIIMTVGIYASNDSTEISKEIKDYLLGILKKYPHIIQMHGFYVDEVKKLVLFDIIFDFDEENQSGVISEINTMLKEKFSEFTFNIIIDTDFSD